MRKQQWKLRLPAFLLSQRAGISLCEPESVSASGNIELLPLGWQGSLDVSFFKGLMIQMIVTCDIADGEPQTSCLCVVKFAPWLVVVHVC